MDAKEVLFRSIRTAIWELGEAITDMPETDLWTRAHPKLWGVGEILGHIAVGFSQNMLGGDENSVAGKEGPRYYGEGPEELNQLPLTCEQLYKEIQRLSELSFKHFEDSGQEMQDTNPHRPDWTWHQSFEYMAFHVAYHAGQIYSVRHMLGHETVDN